MTTQYVLHNGQTAAVKSRNAGWFTLEMPDGSIVKARGCKVISQEYSPDVEIAKTPPADVAVDIVPTYDQAMLIATTPPECKGSPKKAATGASATGPAARMLTIDSGKTYVYGAAGVKTASGNTSYDCGDRVAAMLRGKDLDAVYLFTAQELNRAAVAGEYELKGALAGCETVSAIEKALRVGLARANNGRQRMVLGNRLRGLYRNQP